MQTHEQPTPQPERASQEKLMRAHNFMQFQLIMESGMDEIEWIDMYAAEFRDIVTTDPKDDERTKLTKQAIEDACLKDDIAAAVSLIRLLKPDFPFRAAA